MKSSFPLFFSARQMETVVLLLPVTVIILTDKLSLTNVEIIFLATPPA